MKLKHIVAALALVAAGSANAAIDNGNSTNGTGSLFLVVTDTTAGYSFVGDLGVGMDSFIAASAAMAPGTSQSWNLGGFNSWAPFVSVIGGLTNAKYAVYALDNVGAVGTVDAKRLLTTVAAGDDVTGYVTNNTSLGKAVGATIQTSLGKIQLDTNNVANDHDTVVNGSSYTNKSAAYAQTQFGDSLQTFVPFVTTVPVVAFTDGDGLYHTDTADFWLLGNSSSATLAQANLYQQAGKFSLSASTLAYTVAAVPEPETYALMLAGLGLVGFMARRRKNA